MTGQEHYSLRWNNHQNHILRAFDTLLQTKTLVDVTLVCAETSIRAHKVVLSACSPFFQRVFSETPCKHPVIVLKDFRGWVVQAIVDFMYRGEISVPQERLQMLIQAGESLQVRGLVDHPVTGNTPTPAASPEDFRLIDTSLIAPESPPPSNFSNHTNLLTPTSKLLIPPQVFVDPNVNLPNPEICTSPMPRRKQARPRRRSGDCAPQDLSSKPTTPVPPQPRSSTPTSMQNTEDDIKQVTNGADADEHRPNGVDEASFENVKTKMENLENDKNDKPDMDLDNDEPEDDMVEEEEEEEEEDDDEDLENHLENEKENSPNCNDRPENLCTKKPSASPDPKLTASNLSSNSSSNNNNNNNNLSSLNNNNNNVSDNNKMGLSLKDIRHISRTSINHRPSSHHQLHSLAHFEQQMHLNNNPPHGTDKPNSGGSASGGGGDNSNLKMETEDERFDSDNSPFLEQMDLSVSQHTAVMNSFQQRLESNLSNSMKMNNHKDFGGHMGHPMNLPPPFSQGDHHHGRHPSPLPFPPMPSVSSLTLTPPHMFGLDSPLGLFPHGLEPGKMYSPLMDMSDPRGMHPDHPPFLKKKMSRPKGQHSAPRGGPPRSWTNAELTEALQHVWNKKMTTSQASRIFGIPYNSLLMYVRGKYGKSLKLEQLRKDCISGPPIELLQMGSSHHKEPGSGGRREKEMKEGAGGANDAHHHRSASSEPDLMSSPNPLFNPFPPGFYPDFSGGFPGFQHMLNLLPPDRHPSQMAMNMIDEDCKSDRSKQSLEDDMIQNLSRDDSRREIFQLNGHVDK